MAAVDTDAREPEVMSLRMRNLASAYIAPKVRPAVTAAAVVTWYVSTYRKFGGDVLTRHDELLKLWSVRIYCTVYRVGTIVAAQVRADEKLYSKTVQGVHLRGHVIPFACCDLVER